MHVTRSTKLRQSPAWILLAGLAFLVLWACHLGPEDGEATFDVVGEPSWTECDEVQVVLLDGDGEPVDTLFRGPLESLDQLKKLDAAGYRGGKGAVHIRGTEDGGLCFEQKRSFDSPGGPVKVDTLSDPTVAPASLEVAPESLVVSMGSPAANLSASPVPAYADGDMIWSLDESDVVELEGLSSGRGNPARVKPLRAGAGIITVRSARDTSVSRRVKVRVVSTTLGGIEIGTVNDTVRLYARGPAESLQVEIPAEYKDQKLEWRTGNKAIAEVDASGRIRPVRAGQTHVQATLLPSGLSDVAVVLVKLDAPVLTVESRKGAPVGVDIVFSAKAVQEFGTLDIFKWDLDGDGDWDDSSSVADTGRTVNLPAKKARYGKEGPVTAAFLVRDSEGNEAKAEVLLDIGNQAPEISDRRPDTVISIKDEIPMGATVRDQDGKVAWVGWDYEGDGRFDDTLAASDSVVRFSRRHRFVEAGTYDAVLRAVDAHGKARQDTARIKVELDPPVADAGPDRTVGAGEAITLSAKGTDKFGTISRRAVKCGPDTAFKTLSAQDTTFPAPSRPGNLGCVVRVTDDDGLSDEDEVEITVILSSNADLEDLALSAGSLAPSFRSNTPEYEGRVAFTDSVVTLAPKAKDASAEILVNGKKVVSGGPSAAVKLKVGYSPDAFIVLVTAADGSQRKYTVNMTRDPNGEATLARLEASGLSLFPAFAAGTVDYSDTVRFDVSTATFKATVASVGATLAFGDTAMTSGTFTAPQPLQFGENLFRFTVTAMDGESRTTYTVRILRLGRLITFRKLGGSAATVQDTLDLAVGASRPLSVAGTPAYGFSRWTLLEGKAVLSDSGANPTTVRLESGLARVQAQFNRVFRMTGSVVRGSGTISPRDSLVDSAAFVTWRFRPASGYRFVSADYNFKAVRPWTADSTVIETPKEGATADHDVKVVFRRQYTLVIQPSAEGTLTAQVKPFGSELSVPAVSGQPVDSGSSASFLVEPGSGYRVDTVFVDGRPVATTEISRIGTRSFALDSLKASHVVRVRYKRVFPVTVTVAGSGRVEPPYVPVMVDSGGSYLFRFVSTSTTQVLSGLTDDGKVVPISGEPVSYDYKVENVTGPRTVVATFSQPTFTMIVHGESACIQPACTGTECAPCPIGQASDTLYLPRGRQLSMTISTATAPNRLTRFRHWTSSNSVELITTATATVSVSGDVVYTAVYGPAIVIPIDPPILEPVLEPAPRSR